VWQDEKILGQPLAVLYQRGNVLRQGNKALCHVTKVLCQLTNDQFR
jgi:hypothetical protein